MNIFDNKKDQASLFFNQFISCWRKSSALYTRSKCVYAGTSIAPELMSSMTSCGARPSMVQPTLCAVPSTSFTVPDNSRAIERGRMTLAMLRMSSNVMLPLCLTERMSEIVIHSLHWSRPTLDTHCSSPSFCRVVALSTPSQSKKRLMEQLKLSLDDSGLSDKL